MREESEVSSKRKEDHIELAFKSRLALEEIDQRFNFEPVLSPHPSDDMEPTVFLGKKLNLPIWVSSMTGGTKLAKTINNNLARVCHDFGMGMGLGSCRSLLSEDTYLEDFDVRSIIGPDLPLFANLGIAQVEELMRNNAFDQIERLVDLIQADGLIVHVNPLQEALQPEGDVFFERPIDVIAALLEVTGFPIIVKEVGQGMGKESLQALLNLPLAAVDFGASGGTNFALLELLRKEGMGDHLKSLAHIGHSATEMVTMVNELINDPDVELQCKEVIISGGIRDFLDGYYLIEKLKLNSVYGQASAFLKYAMGEYQQLHTYVSIQAKGFALAKAYLKPK